MGEVGLKLSVLMSVYVKEKSSYLVECLESLIAQTFPPDQVVLVQDGILTDDLYAVIDRYSNLMPLVSVRLATNQGLARALNEGLKHCEGELVARMDTDDVALSHRFERQVTYMNEHSDVDVCSSWIEERSQTMQETLFLKELPESHIDILNFSKRRNPISHPAAMLRKEAVMAVGGYPEIFPEDYALWSLMLVRGFKFANIQEVLLYMRTGDDFIGRRGLSFFRGEIKLLKYQRDLGFLIWPEYLLNILLRAAIRLPPPSIRRLLYRCSR